MRPVVDYVRAGTSFERRVSKEEGDNDNEKMTRKKTITILRATTGRGSFCYKCASISAIQISAFGSFPYF